MIRTHNIQNATMAEIEIKDDIFGLGSLFTIELDPRRIELKNVRMEEGQKSAARIENIGPSETVVLELDTSYLDYEPAPDSDNGWETLPVEDNGAVKPPEPENLTTILDEESDHPFAEEISRQEAVERALITGWDNGGSVLTTDTVPIPLMTEINGTVILQDELNRAAIGFGQPLGNEYFGIRYREPDDDNDLDDPQYEFYAKSRPAGDDAENLEEYVDDDSDSSFEPLDFDPFDIETEDDRPPVFNYEVRLTPTTAIVNLSMVFDEEQKTARFRLPRYIDPYNTTNFDPQDDTEVSFLAIPFDDADSDSEDWRPIFSPVEYINDATALRSKSEDDD